MSIFIKRRILNSDLDTHHNQMETQMKATKKFYTGEHSKQVGETNIEVCNRYPQAGSYWDESAVLWQIFRFDYMDINGNFYPVAVNDECVLTCEAKQMDEGDGQIHQFIVEWLDGSPSDELIYKTQA